MQFKSRVVLVYSWVGVCATAWAVAGPDAWASARDVLTDQEPQQLTVELDRKFVEQELSAEANPTYLVIQEGRVIHRQPGPKTIRQSLNGFERFPSEDRIKKLMEDRLLDKKKPFCILVSEFKDPVLTIEPNRLVADEFYSPSRYMSDQVFERDPRYGNEVPISEYRSVRMTLLRNNRLECRSAITPVELVINLGGRYPGWRTRSHLRDLKLSEVRKQLSGMIALKSEERESTQGSALAPAEPGQSSGLAY